MSIPFDKPTSLKWQLEDLLRKYQSAIWTLQEIAAMGNTKGCESARHRLIQLGELGPDYRTMT